MLGAATRYVAAHPGAALAAAAALVLLVVGLLYYIYTYAGPARAGDGAPPARTHEKRKENKKQVEAAIDLLDTV